MRMGQRGTSLATYDSRRFPYQLVVGQRLHHEECEVDTSGHVALENGIADMATPNGQPLALPFLEVAASDHGPAGVTLEDPAGGRVLLDTCPRNRSRIV